MASGDAAGLAEEVEAALPSLYRQVWGFVNFVAFKLRTVNKLMLPEQQFVFGTDHTGRDSALRLGVSMGYSDIGKVPDNPWVVPVHTTLLGSTLTDAYVKRPGVQTVCDLLTYKANDIAPGFVLQGGLISIKPRTVPGAEAGSNHTHIHTGVQNTVVILASTHPLPSAR